MKNLFFTISIMSSFLANAQQTVNVDENQNITTGNVYIQKNGLLASPEKYVKVVDGTPFYSKTWMKGIVYFLDGSVTSTSLLRVNIMDAQLNYLSDNLEYVANPPYYKVRLLDTTTAESYHFIYSTVIEDSSKTRLPGWYLQLNEGKEQILVYYRKYLIDYKPYLSSIIEQKVETETLYFYYKNFKLYPFKKFKNILNLTDHKTEMAAFIETAHLTGKKFIDFEKLGKWLQQKQ